MEDEAVEDETALQVAAANAKNEKAGFPAGNSSQSYDRGPVISLLKWLLIRQLEISNLEQEQEEECPIKLKMYQELEG